MTSTYHREIEEQANALTTCSICTDVFTNPKVLPCQHTFCLTCLQKHHDATNSQRLVPVSSFACPACRKVCYVPRHSLDQLPTDFKVDQILDLVKVISRSMPSAKGEEEVGGSGRNHPQGALADCVVCRSARGLSVAADVFCVQCVRSFCKGCADHHSGTPVFQNHTVVPALAPAASSSSAAAAWKCALHDHEVQYFCDRCVAPACTICVLSIHEKHPVSDQKTAASRFYDQLARSCDELCQKREDLQRQLGALTHLRQEHGRNLQESERSVLGASREAYRMIRDLEEQTLVDVRSYSKEKLDRISSLEKELSTRTESLAALCQSLTEVLSYANPKAFFDSYSQLAVKAQGEMGDEGPDVGAGTALRSVSTFVPHVQVKLGEMEKRSLSVTELIKAPLTTYSEMPRASETESPMGGGSKDSVTGSSSSRQGHQRRRSEAESRASPIPEPSRGRRTDFLNTLERRLNSKPSKNNNNNSSDGISLATFSPTDTKNNLSNKGNNNNNKKTDTKNNDKVTGSSARPRDSHGVTENALNGDAVRPRRSATFSSRGDLMMTRDRSAANSSSSSSSPTNFSGAQPLWISTEFSNCRDCCVVSGCLVAATDCSVVGGRIRMFAGISGDLVDVVDSCLVVQPWGICYNSSTGYMLLTDHGGSPSLKTVRVGSTRDVRVYRCPTIDRPSGVAVTRSGDVVVSDTGSRRYKIGIFSTANGRMTKIREFGSRGDGEGEVLRANYVTVDHNDRVIVSDVDGHTVKVFGLTGQQLLKFSSSGSDGREMSPQGLAVDDANNIFVADQATQAVVKYSPHGQLIETVAQTVGVPWGISICWEEGLLAAATSSGLEVFRL